MDAPEGFEHYLLKFDGVVEKGSGRETFGDPMGYGRIEYAYHLMATAAGVNMMPCSLLEENGRAHIVTKRFDREGNDKRHVLTLCALAHADYKMPGTFSYEEAFSVLRELKAPRSDAVELYRRMVFNVLARNQDDHSKNTAFVLASKDAGWRLSPAYDVSFSYKPGSPWVESHQLSLNGKRDHFIRDDLQSVAGQIHNFRQQAEVIIDEVSEAVSQWPRYAAEADVPHEQMRHIQSCFRHL